MDWYKEPYFIWFCIGLGFLLLEIGIPGLILFFFGIGAWVASVYSFLTHGGVNSQIVVFLVSSLLSLVLFRRSLKKRFFDEGGPSPTLEDEFIGKKVVASSDFTNGEGKVQFKGTDWNASSLDQIQKGQKVEITDKDSITLIVKSIDQ